MLGYNVAMKVVNKRAVFDYDVLETLEVGIVLTGAEVKSIKDGSISLSGSRVVIGTMDDDKQGREGAWLIGATISLYKHAAVTEDYDPIRSRKLLLKKEQLQYLKTKVEAQGLTLIPLSCYTKRDLIKLEIALARGKKQFEKREIARKREIEKKLKQVLKSQGREG